MTMIKKFAIFLLNATYYFNWAEMLLLTKIINELCSLSDMRILLSVFAQ